MTAPRTVARDLLAPITPTATTGSWVVGTVVGVAVLSLLLTGNPMIPLALVIVATIAFAVYHAPLRWSALALLSLATFADIIPWDPNTAKTWASIASPLQLLLLENLNKLVGVDALKFSGMEVAIVALLLLMGFRLVTGQRVDTEGSVPAPAVLLWAFGLSLATALALGVIGAARGGDLRQSFWQMRYMMWTPVIGLLLSGALRGARDVRLLLGVLTCTCFAKVAMAAWFMLVVVRRSGTVPPMATSHMDTVLFVSVLAIWAAIAVDRPTAGRLVMTLVVWGWTVFGMVLNNRRTAIVSLVTAMILLLVSLSAAVKRKAAGLFVIAVILAVPYLILGRNRTGGIFAPAAQFWSVLEQKDSSSITRDIENFNLIVTLKQSILTGTGWGHEYIELVKGDDISQVFAQYRYIAHNSVLWLLSIAGSLGLTLLWLPITVGIFLATRAQRAARTHAERVTTYAAIAITACYLLQAWSDMGVQSWTTAGLLTGALVSAAKIGVANGSWRHRNYTPDGT